MNPAGYLYKRIVAATEVVSNPDVRDIYSVAGCISEDFLDYIPHWKHNGHWFFDSPKIMDSLAADLGISVVGLKLFYYRIYPLQWDDDSRTWESFEPCPDFETNIVEPVNAKREGFDVVSYAMQNSPECSPLSCNDLCEAISVNAHCLFATLEDAKRALEAGLFVGGERGPYRIIEVCSP